MPKTNFLAFSDIKYSSAFKTNNICIISDKNINEIYNLDDFFSEEKGKRIKIILEAGDENKNFHVLQSILVSMNKRGFAKDTTIVAIGGGMVLDMAGTAGSIYRSGIEKTIYIPTTLLAMVDAAFGGKNAVNMPQGKNLVGTFREADEILICMDFLNSLPRREKLAGLSEIIKYGLIFSKDILNILLEKNIDGMDDDELKDIIQRSIAVKQHFVEKDKKDFGIRKMLNFGHTIGHAIEAANGFSNVLHGEAVAKGMMLAIEIGILLGITDKNTLHITREIYKKQGIDSVLENLERNLKAVEVRTAIEEALYMDKKSTGECIEMVLLRKKGEPVLHEMEQEKLRRVLWEVLGGKN